MEALITDWIPTLLRKTREHEGSYWSAQANLDGNGVSYGILQWTQKSGRSADCSRWPPLIPSRSGASSAGAGRGCST